MSKIMWIQTDKGKYRSSDDRFTLTKIDSINWELFDVQTEDTYSAKNAYCKQRAEGVLRREAPRTINTARRTQKSLYKPHSKSASHSKRHASKRLWSVLTPDMDHCMFTGSADVERHHVFGGISSVKANSERYGFVAPLRPDLHPNGVQRGNDAPMIDKYLKETCQKYYEEHYGTREQFIQEFGKSYL